MKRTRFLLWIVGILILPVGVFSFWKFFLYDQSGKLFCHKAISLEKHLGFRTNKRTPKLGGCGAGTYWISGVTLIRNADHLVNFSAGSAVCPLASCPLLMKASSTSSKVSRRQFIATTAAAIAAPTFIPASALGKAGRPTPSERIVVGIVGWGMQGPGNTSGLMAQKDCQVVAACDLDTRPLQKAVDTINKKYGNTDCKSYHDYREMVAR